VSVWDVSLAVEAFRRQRAIVKTARQLIEINDDAMVFCPLSMAGWDPTVQAAAIGRRGGSAQIISCADPREWDLQLETFSRLKAIIEPWFISCYKGGEGDSFPQLIVQSTAAAQLLVGLAYRIAWLDVPEQAGKDRKRWTQDARQLGRMLLFFVQQMEVAGQQSVIVASQALNEHYVIGQDATDHLGALLTWIDPPRGENVALAALRAQRETLGVRTTPEFDEELADLIAAFLKVKNGDPSRRSFAQRRIEDLMEEELLEPLWDATNEAIDQIEELRLAPLPALEPLRKREVRAFHGHMRHLERDGWFSKRDRTRAAVRGLTVMEDAAEQWAKAKLWGDPITLAKARFDGDVLHGAVRHSRAGAQIISQQTALKVRRGDELCLMADPDVKALVERIHREGDSTVVTLNVNGSLDAGAVTDWTGSPPAWHMLGISLGKVFRRMASNPVTHREDGGGDPVRVPPMTSDPMIELQRFEKA